MWGRGFKASNVGGTHSFWGVQAVQGIAWVNEVEWALLDGLSLVGELRVLYP